MIEFDKNGQILTLDFGYHGLRSFFFFFFFLFFLFVFFGYFLLLFFAKPVPLVDLCLFRSRTMVLASG